MLRTVLAIALFAPSLAPAAGPDTSQVEFFEKKIRPVLVEQCYKCHSAAAEKEKKLKGGLKLDTRADLLKGGQTGVTLVPGKPDDGTLLKSLRYDDEDLQMPPKGKLPDAVVKDFEKWIRRWGGGPAGGETAARTGRVIDIARGKEFWSFRLPIEPAVPTIQRSKLKGQNEIDAFVAVKWAEKGLTPAGPADKRTLIRRATFDLIGLPPTPEEVDDFLKDETPGAFAKVVDRLLASPHHGEKWARHWLDVARYSEDQAHTFAVKPKTQAWRYRDWVIAALNADMPYDRFVKLQIAGDMMKDGGEDPFVKYAGLGFNGLGAEYYKNSAKDQAVAEELDDRVDALSRGFLAITVSCAALPRSQVRPDPDPRLLLPRRHLLRHPAHRGAALSSGGVQGVHGGAVEAQVDGGQAQEGAVEREDQARRQDAIGRGQENGRGGRQAQEGDAEAAAGGARGQRQWPGHEGLYPRQPGHQGRGRTEGVSSGAAVLDSIRQGLLAARPGQRHRLQRQPADGAGDRQSRLGVALRPRAGLDAVELRRARRPAEPSRTARLAGGQLHEARLVAEVAAPEIVSSGVYQLDCKSDANNDKVDAANIYLWRANRRRLEIELWRDSLLAVSGKLDPARGGPTFDLKNANATRRTVYAKISRHELDGLLRLFDFPDANVTAAGRSVTTVPQQQLFALNSEFMAIQAKAFAARVEKLGSTDSERITAAYRLAFGRAPETRESTWPSGS